MWPSFSVTVAINCGINGRSYVSSLILEAIGLEKDKNITLYNLLRDVQCVFVCVCEGEKGWEHVRWRSVSVRSVWVWEVLVGQKDESCVVIPGSLWISGLCPEPLCDAASLVSNTLKVEARVLLLLNGTEEIWRTWRFPHVFWIMDQKLEAIWQRLVTYNPPCVLSHGSWHILVSTSVSHLRYSPDLSVTSVTLFSNRAPKDEIILLKWVVAPTRGQNFQNTVAESPDCTFCLMERAPSWGRRK